MAEFENVKNKVKNKIYSLPTTNSLKKESKTKADVLIKLVEKMEVELFHDQYQEPYALISDSKKKILKIRSKGFKRWLAHKAWTELNEAIGSEARQSALNVLEGKSLFEGKTYELNVRVAWHNGAIWYDLADGKAVKIDSSGWEIINNPPILFKNFPHQEIQVEPVNDGQLEKVLDFMNIPPKLKGERLLQIIALVTGLIPDIPHPIINYHGTQGSGKTTSMKIMKQLLDPSVVRTLTLSHDLKEFVQTVSHHWFIPIDNLSRLNTTFSDALCRVVSGEGFSKRELYSDDDDVMFSFQRAIAMNGINLVAEKGDILDRSLIIPMDRIHNFREERELWKNFEEVKPEILGAMFSTLAHAMAYIDKIILPGKMRMADFARWGCAVSRALNLTDKDFLQAYKKNILRQHVEAIDASFIGTSIMELMKETKEWRGTPTELLSKLKDIAFGLDLDIRIAIWPKDPRSLRRRIKEILPNLRAKGIKIDDLPRREILLRKTNLKSKKNIVNVVNVVQNNLNDINQ